MDVEVSFPRGGVKPSKRPNSEPVNNIFTTSRKEGSKQKHESKKQKRSLSPVQTDISLNNRIQAASADSLTYEKVQEGMLILGCVHSINALYLDIELPGRVFGKVEIGNLSKAYTNYLKESVASNSTDEILDRKRLEKLYFIGQILPTKVLEVKHEANTQLLLSVDPSDVNADISPTAYKAGALLWAAVLSKSDHGYVLDIGNENCRVFLPFKNVGDEFEIGQTIWCVVKKSQTISNISTLTVTAIRDEVINTTQNNFNLHSIIPGMQFDFTVTKVIKHGLEGKLSNNSLGYINQVFLRKPLQQITKYKIGTTYKARLLYVEPITKFIFLTLRRIDVFSAPVYPRGTIQTVQIVSKTNGGMFVKFPNNEKGFVSNKRLVNAVSSNKQTKLQETVKNKFPVGSSHHCRILSYSRLEQIYIGSLEQSVLKEKVFSSSDLTIGELVKVKVVEIVDKGLVVKLGQVTGFIQNIHLSNVEYSENIKKKFFVNQSLKVRVWNIDDRGVYFTYKQALMHTTACNYDDVVINNQYLGVVVHIRKDGSVLVIFFGDLKGFLPRPSATFFIGQVILTTVVEKTPQGLKLSLDAPVLPKPKNIETGDYVDVVVEEICKDSLIVTTQHNLRCKIPLAHLSCSLSLNPLLLKTYKVGDKLKDVICIDHEELPILSPREAFYYRSNNLHISKYEDLVVGSILRGFCISSNKKSITVTIPFKPLSKTQNILYKYLVRANTSASLLKFQPQQPILVKVTEIDHEKDKLELTGKLTDVYHYDTIRALDYLEHYLHNSQKIQTCLQNNTPIANLNIGQQVECEVQNFDELGCMVFINGTRLQGLANKKLCPGDLHIGQKLKGVVLWINYAKNCVHVVLQQHIVKKISKVQDGNISKPLSSALNAKVLMIDDDFVIALLQIEKTNNQLIFLPTYIHENSFVHKMNGYHLLEVIKVILSRKVGNFLIGMDKEFKRSIKSHLLEKGKFVNVPTSNLGSVNTSLKEQINSEKCTPKPTNKRKRPEVVNEEAQDLASSTNIVCSPKLKIKGNVEETKLNNKQKPNGLHPLDVEILPAEPNIKIESGFSSINTFFTSDSPQAETNDTSDDEIITEPVPKKKKKLSAAERAELAKIQEEEILKKELENANLSGDPETPDQFDRLLLGKPNSSELWAKYITYYVMQTEFEKARAIARRALKTIDLHESNERFNIWIILLRLENSHGDKNTFDQVFEEAVSSNEPLGIYLEAIKILSESHKFDEMETKIKKVRNKFKQDLEMWITVANVYFENKMLKEARDLKDAALRTIKNNRDHIKLIVQFALLEFRYGEINSAEVLFETLLQSSPKRIDVWTTYIDQVIKTRDIEKARRIFDRATAQDIPLKKKKSLFNKYKEFEIKYGTKETIQRLTETIKQHFGMEKL